MRRARIRPNVTLRRRPTPKTSQATRDRRAKKRAPNAKEAAAKRESKQRDGMQSRYPGEPFDGSRLESAHLKGKGMGGDPKGRRSWQASDYITLTHKQHRRWHDGYLRVEFGPEGGDGCVSFSERGSIHSDNWRTVGGSWPPTGTLIVEKGQPIRWVA